MSVSRNSILIASCSCGSVEFEAVGHAIMSVACYCDDCQEAARRIEALAGAPSMLDPDGGTAYVLYRKDRVRCSKGAGLLKAIKLRPESATNRVVAGCCNSAMLLNFDDGKHWVDVYRGRLRGEVPPLQMRVCTRFRPGRGPLPADVPGHPSYPPKFIGKLLAARLAMLFRPGWPPRPA
ncbi:MAG: DUF6151 family protein [Nevskia sp.]|nr:DUF6151 family protein [Nevskia sp.]